MKLIGLTQRLSEETKYLENRDCIDRRWPQFLLQSKAAPVLLPNNIEVAKHLISLIPLSGFILTGGGDLTEYGGDDPQRDELERFLIQYSIENNIPLLGVCRGMQQIIHFFSGTLEPVSSHVQDQQSILIDNQEQSVNSYHTLGAYSVPDCFKVFAKSHDNVIKAIKHKKYAISAIMWHPERIAPFRQQDVLFFENKFHKQ